MRTFGFRDFLGSTFIFICSLLGHGCTQPGPVEVIELHNPRKIDFAATNDLIIKWYPDTFSLYLRGDSLKTNDLEKTDRFIEQRISDIDKKNVLFIGETDTSYQQFKDLTEVLHKYGITKFKVLAAHEVY